MFNYAAFESHKLIARGPLEKVALETRKRLRQNGEFPILIFSELTGRPVDIDLRGSESDVIARLRMFRNQTSDQSSAQTQGVGRPRLGVVAREISLLPHHWEWLINQEGGSSSTLRTLIEEKIKRSDLEKSQEKNRVKQAQEVTFKFLNAIAGDLPKFEEVTRYLYRKDHSRFQELMSDWPKDIVKQALRLSEEVFK